MDRVLWRRDGSRHPAPALVDGAHQVRRDQRTAVGHGRDHRGERHRRDADRALADSDGNGLAGVPLRRALSIETRPLGRRHEARLFVRQVDAGLARQPEHGRVLVDRVDAEALADVVEVDVARALDRVAEVEAAVAAQALERAAVERRLARTIERRFRRDRAVHQAGNRHDDLERRSRRVRALNQTVRQRAQRIGKELRPRGPVDADREGVGIERRQARHRQNLTGVRIEKRRRAVVIADAEAVLERLLHVVVNRELQAAPVDRCGPR